MPKSKNRPTPKAYRLSPAESEAQRELCGKRIRALRRSEGLNAIAFARAIGYDSHSAVLEWEKGVRLPSAEALSGICRQFRVAPGWLLGVESERKAHEALVLQDGTVISDEQLDEALRLKALKSLERRTSKGDRVAKFIRQVASRNKGDLGRLLPPGPCVAEAVAHLVALAERIARRQWRINASQRVARLIEAKLPHSDVVVGELAGRLIFAELEYEQTEAFDETQLKQARWSAWKLYRRDSVSDDEVKQ